MHTGKPFAIGVALFSVGLVLGGSTPYFAQMTCPGSNMDNCAEMSQGEVNDLVDFVQQANWDLSEDCSLVKAGTLAGLQNDTMYWYDSQVSSGNHIGGSAHKFGINRAYGPGGQFHGSLPLVLAHEGAHHAGFSDAEIVDGSLESCILH